MRSIYEKRAQQELEAEGWKVDYKIRASFPIRGYNVDYFNCFDLLAIKSGQPTRWIFIKGTRGILDSERDLIRACPLGKGNLKEMWWVNDVGVWRKEIIP